MRDGNPLFIPETGGEATNCLRAFVDYNAIGFSPFGISGEGGGGPRQNDGLAQTYNVLQYIAPDVLACQAKGTIVRLPAGQTQQEVKLGNYTLTVNYLGGAIGGGGGGGRGGRGGAVQRRRPRNRLPVNRRRPPCRRTCSPGRWCSCRGPTSMSSSARA